MGMYSSALVILTVHVCNVLFTVESMQTEISRVLANNSSRSESEIRLMMPHSDCFGTLVGMRNVSLISVPFWVVFVKVLYELYLVFHVSP
jgi:hypothetical protein